MMCRSNNTFFKTVLLHCSNKRQVSAVPFLTALIYGVAGIIRAGFVNQGPVIILTSISFKRQGR